MKFSRVFLVLCFLMAPSVAQGAAAIALDHVTGLWDGNKVSVGCTVRFTFRLTNTTGDFISGFANGFRIWTEQGGDYTHQFEAISFDTLPVGWGSMMDGGVFLNPFSADGVGADTIGFGGFKMFQSGIPSGFDEQVWWIETRVTGDGDLLCIDSSWYPPGGAWNWGMVSIGSVVPDWSGPHCYEVAQLPCGWVTFQECPSELTFNVYEMAEYTFYAINETMYPMYPTNFIMHDGIGSLTEIDDTTAVWSYTPVPADVGRTEVLRIEAIAACVCELCEVTVHFVEAPLAFTSGCHDTAVVAAGASAALQVTTNWEEVTYTATPNRAPAGSHAIDANGELTFNTDPTDRGHYIFDVCGSAAGDTVCCPVVFLVTNDVCVNRGNVDGIIGPGGAIDVGDLTYLSAFLFQNGPPPPCIEEGNVDALLDGEFAVTVADMSYLVAFLFSGGPLPPPC